MIGAASAPPTVMRHLCGDHSTKCGKTPSGSSKCADEGKTCKVPASGGTVYYGTPEPITGTGNIRWYHKEYSGAASVKCNNDNFCDVRPGRDKYCYR